MITKGTRSQGFEEASRQADGNDSRFLFEYSELRKYLLMDPFYHITVDIETRPFAPL